MKKISKINKNKKIITGNPSHNLKEADNKKFDIYQLQSLLEDLKKKDLEYDLIIKGLKEKINNTKRDNNYLDKEIEQLKSENIDIDIKNTRLNFENKYNKKEIKNKIEYNNKMEILKNDNINEKYKEELNRNKEIKNKISNIQQEINNYQNRLFELDSILNYTNPKIQKEGEDMKKFLSEL